MDSTKPASRNTRKCLDTVGWGMRRWRSISPTDCCDETRRLNIARRFGSAMTSNTDSMLLIYHAEYMRVKAYNRREPVLGLKDEIFLEDLRAKTPDSTSGAHR